MRKVVDYKIVSNEFHGHVELEVKKQISKGWQPFGGISLMSNGYTGQAMVVYEEMKDEQ